MRALVRRPGPALRPRTSSGPQRPPIDIELARAQHAVYVDTLAELGLQVQELDPLDDAPDACFVGDLAVVLDEVGVMARPALASRRRELAALHSVLGRERQLLRIEEPATLEGGDVLVVDDTLYVGWSSRTNHAGLRALAHLVLPFGYRVKAVEVRGCLHLRSALSRVGPRTLLANPAWFHGGRIAGLEILAVDPSEPFAADALLVGETLLLAGGSVRTEAALRARGIEPLVLELSELRKADAGPSSLALLVRGRPKEASG